jgi:hypothetical protein
MEEWKCCFEDYEISNLGNVRRKLKMGRYKCIYGSILNSGTGYKYFQLQRDGKRINFYFHHLVAEFFIGIRNNNLVIDHIDRNSLNNNVNNLRYVSPKENCRNSDRFKSHIDGDGIERKKKVSKEWRNNNKEHLSKYNKEYRLRIKEINKT